MSSATVPQIGVDPQQMKSTLLEIKGQIDNFDATLDSAAGSTASFKRVAETRVIERSQDTWEGFVSTVLGHIHQADDPAVRAGTVLALQKALDENFSSVVDETVKAEIEVVESEHENREVDPEELQVIEEQRKEAVEKFKAVKNLLSMFGVEGIDSIPDPKSRRGSRGPRGPRTLAKFDYTVNDTEIADSKLSIVANMCGVKTKELKDHIKSQGIDLTDPPTSWEAELPNDIGILYAEKKAEYLEEDDVEGEEA